MNFKKKKSKEGYTWESFEGVKGGNNLIIILKKYTHKIPLSFRILFLYSKTESIIFQ